MQAYLTPSLIMAENTLRALTAIAALLSATVAFTALIVTIRSGVRNKRADVLIECHRRLDALMVAKVTLVQKLASNSAIDELTRIDLLAWAHRFWSLQFDQYEFWQQGHIDTETYTYWMLSRYRDWQLAKGGSAFEKRVIIEGWEDVKDRWAPPRESKSRRKRTDFLDFIQKINDCTSPANVPPIVRQYKPRGWRRLGTKL